MCLSKSSSSLKTTSRDEVPYGDGSVSCDELRDGPWFVTGPGYPISPLPLPRRSPKGVYPSVVILETRLHP